MLQCDFCFVDYPKNRCFVETIEENIIIQNEEFSVFCQLCDICNNISVFLRKRLSLIEKDRFVVLCVFRNQVVNVLQENKNL